MSVERLPIGDLVQVQLSRVSVLRKRIRVHVSMAPAPGQIFGPVLVRLRRPGKAVEYKL